MPTTKTKAIIQCGDTTLICDREYERGLWTIPIGKNENNDEKTITATNKIKNFDTGPNKLKHAGWIKRRIRKKKPNRSARD